MATSRIYTTVHVELTALEAIWLRALLQNPQGDAPEDEFNRTHREAIFSALPALTEY